MKAAPTIYHDGESLFLEFPTYALRFPFTEGGLGKALATIPKIAGRPSYLTGRPGNIPSGTVKVNGKIAKIAKGTAKRREILNFSSSQRSFASEIVRKLKVGQ